MTGSNHSKPLTSAPGSSLNRNKLSNTLQRQAWFFSTPSFAVILAITIFPILFSIYTSLNNVEISPTGYVFHWTGLKNYGIVLHNSMFHHALIFTIVYTVVTVCSELVLGLLVALVLDKMVHGRGFMLAILLIPWSLITVVAAEIWGYIYNGVYGVLDAIVVGLHLSSHNIIWLGSPVLAQVSLMVADIWKTTPFVAIMLLAGLQMINRDVYEAAQIDGSSAWNTFWRITLPLLRPTIGITVLMRMLQAFGVYDLPYVLTNGGPGTSTESLAMLGYQVMFAELHIGTGAAVASTTSIIIFILAIVFRKLFRAQVGEEELTS